MRASLKRRLATFLLENHPHDAARTIEQCKPASVAALFAEMDPKVVGKSLVALTPHLAPAVYRSLTSDQQADAIAAIDPRFTAPLLRRLSRDERDAALKRLPAAAARKLQPLLNPLTATAAALAEPDVLVLYGDTVVRDVLKAHRDALIRAVHDVPVVDRDQRLLGTVAPERLLHAPKDDKVVAVAHSGGPKLSGSAGLREMVRSPGWLDVPSIPVVDGKGQFIGLLKYDALRWAEQQLNRVQPAKPISTSRALGELFATAVGGMFEAVASTGEKSREK